MANPLVKLEFARRFRSPIAAWAIPLLILLPGLAVTVIYSTITTTTTGFDAMGNQIDDGTFAVSDLRGVGVGMFVAVLAMLLLALILMVPSTVGASIAGERQSQTLQPLQLTEMTPGQIVRGKLVSSVAYLLLLLLCAAPVLTIPFLLGGTSAAVVIGAFVVLVLVAFEFAAISLAASSLMSRPAPGIIVSLLACAFVTIAPWIAMGIAFALASQGNPMFDAADSPLRYLSSFSPVALGSWVTGAAGEDMDEVATWGDRVASAMWFGVLTVGALWLARSRVVAPVERDR